MANVTESVHDEAGHGDHAHPSFLQHHFDTPAQQFDASKLGMWVFIATEILMFGGLFCAYAIWRGLRAGDLRPGAPLPEQDHGRDEHGRPALQQLDRGARRALGAARQEERRRRRTSSSRSCAPSSFSSSSTSSTRTSSTSGSCPAIASVTLASAGRSRTVRKSARACAFTRTPRPAARCGYARSTSRGTNSSCRRARTCSSRSTS